MEMTSTPSPKRSKTSESSSNNVLTASPSHHHGGNNRPSPLPPTARQHQDVRTTLQHFCTSIGINEEVTKETLAVWDDVFHHQQLSDCLDMQGEDAVWFCCFIYIASVHVRTQKSMSGDGSKENATVSLTDILRPARVTVSDLFKKMKLLREAHPLGATFLQQLLLTEKKFLITCPLFSKFERMFDAIFLPEHDQYTINGSHSMNGGDYLLKKKLCWTLFIYAKSAASGSGQQLVISFYLLLSCIDYVMSSTPAFMLKAPFNDGDRLTELCSQYHAPVDEVKEVYSECLEPVLASLSTGDGCIDLAHLTNMYMLTYTREADVNELLFLSRDAHLQVKPYVKQSQEVLNNNNVSPTVSPFATPVRAAMNTVQQLRNLLDGKSQEPSSGLIEYFTRCSTNPRRSIEACIQLLHETFAAAFIAAAGSAHQPFSEQRFVLAQRLYYHVMEAMLNLEQQRLAQGDFTSLLNNMTFHKCLLACALEVVLVTYERGHDRSPDEDSPTSFPWILNAFNIQAYDFFKVLESFIKAEPKLMPEAVKHLQTVENKILESIVWQEGSSLYDILLTSVVNQASHPPASPGRPTESGPSAAQLYLSPHPPRYPQPRVVEAGQSTPPRRNSQSLNMFFNKVCRLSYQRLQYLCDRLHIPRDVQQKIWTCLEYCITQRYDLLKNRQIDQVMMCCVYAISKVAEREVRFKVIVNEYRSMPHVTPQVYRRVYISGNEYDSLIGFYNRIYMNAMKSYVLQFAPNRLMPSLSPLPSSPLPSSPGYPVPGRKNFFVSPLKQSPFKTPASPGQLTPRSRQLYNFGEGPGSSENLRNINETMRALANQIPAVRQPPRSQKRLQFDNVPEEASASSSQPLIPVRRVTPAASRKCLTFADTTDGAPASSGVPSEEETS